MKITKMQVRDWWMRLNVAIQAKQSVENDKICFKVLDEMKAASKTPFFACPKCGKRMKQGFDSIQKKKSKYLKMCECTPNLTMVIG